MNKNNKKEFVKDGYSARRRKAFAQVGNAGHKGPTSLDEYIQFLMEVQSTFSPFAVSKKKTITTFNKL